MKVVKMETKNVSANEILQQQKKKKTNKIEQQKRYTEQRKKDYEIYHTSKRKKYNLAQSCKFSQIENSQDKITHDNTQIDSNKCLCKRDIAKKERK